jgi:hypothetical protein
MFNLRLKEGIAARIRKKKPAPFEPWCLYPQGQEMYDQTQPLAVLPSSSPAHETCEQRYRRVKALADATGERLFFAYLHDQGRPTIQDRRRRKGTTEW